MGPWLVEVLDRPELEGWLHGGPPEFEGSTILFVLGDTPDIRVFLPNALDAAKRDDGRVVVWVKDPALFVEEEKKHIFGDGRTVVAASLGGSGTVGGWVNRDRLRIEDAEFAFAGAEEERG